MYDDEETIYGLIPKPPPKTAKGPLYRSKFRHTYNFESVPTAAHATMGEPLDFFRRTPDKFLRKGSRCPNISHDFEPVHEPRPLVKPPVPSARVGRTAPRRQRNFILENWKSAPLTRKLHPERPEIDWTKRKGFGKVPKYLNRVRQEAMDEQAYWDQERERLQPQDREPRCRLLSDEERIKVLTGLQQNLDSMKQFYNSMPFGHDNLSFIRKKTELEAQMSQLERDIATFSKKNIYVTED